MAMNWINKLNGCYGLPVQVPREDNLMLLELWYARFFREVAAIEKEAINFIDESFKKLRSAQGAFDLLQKFKHIRSRQAINKQMLMKFDNILERYEKEVSLLLM